MIKGIIFDMDGVVIDSNYVHYQNWSQVFRNKFNVFIPEAEFASRLGESSKHFTEFFLSRYNIAYDIEDLIKEIRAYYTVHGEKVILKPGIKDALPVLKKDYRIALATGADKEWAIDALTRLGVIEHFDFIIAGNEVKRAKPEPEIFLKAAEGLGLKPEECAVIEDANFGLRAAKAAGMVAISIPDRLTVAQDHSMADMKLSSAQELPEILKTL